MIQHKASWAALPCLLLSWLLLVAPLSRASETYETSNILVPGDIEGTYQWCTPGVNCWNGTSGGQIPNWSGDTVYWGYGGGILSWTTAVNTALQQAGLQVDGFRYVWTVKNYDTNYVAEQNDGDDYMRISVRIYDSAGTEVWGKQYNLDGTYDWSTFTGTELFSNPLAADNLSNIIIRAEGNDPGYWAGYYGPEFNVAGSSVTLIYSQDPCYLDPLISTTCSGYSEAYAQLQLELQLAEQQQQIMDQIAGNNTSNSADDGSNRALDSGATTSNLSEDSGTTAETANDTTNNMDPQGSGTESMGMESSSTSTEVAETEESAESSTAAGPGLNANQLNALAAAANASRAAESVASEQAAVGSASGVGEAQALAEMSASLDASGISDVAGGSGISGLPGSGDLDPSGSDGIATDFSGSEISSTGSVASGSSQSGDSVGAESDVAVDASLAQETAQTQTDLSEQNTVLDFALDLGNATTEQNTGQQDDPASTGEALATEEITGEQALEQIQELAESSELAVDEIQIATVDLDLLDRVANQVVTARLQELMSQQEETLEEKSSQDLAQENRQEDQLVEQALAGSTDEDAQAALLGFNPAFRAYQQPQMPDTVFYPEREIYAGQRTWDNPGARLFNGASDAAHRQMVRSQWENMVR